MPQVKAYTAKLQYGAGSDYTTESSWTSIANVKNIKPFKVTAKDIDVTVLDTADEFETFIPGLANGGDLELSIQYASTQAATLYGLFRTLKAWRLVYADASGWKFDGYINEYSDDEIVNGEIVMTTIKMKVTVKPVQGTGLS